MKTRGRLLCFLSILILSVTSILNGSVTCFASEEDGEVSSTGWFVYVSGEMPDITMKQGETRDFTLEIKANYELAFRKITIGTTDTPFTVKGTPKVYKENSVSEALTIDTGKQYLKFTLYAKKSTENKTYNLPITFLAGYLNELATYTLMDKIPVTYQADTTTGKGSLSISDITCDNDMKVGESTNVVYSLSNIGDGKAYDITLAYDGFEDTGILPGNNTTTKKLTSLSANTEKSFTFPITVSKNAVTGAKKLSISVSYKTTEDAAEKVTETESFYIQVEGKATETEKTVKAPKLLISGVKQSPAEPKAGGTLKLSFTVKNIGSKNAKNITLTPTNLANTNFSPVDKDPNIYIKLLKVGASKKVTMRFTISDTIEKGLNPIEFAVAFKDNNGTDYTDTAKMYVTDVKASDENTSGVPKLIIQHYSTGDDIVRAGSEFNFTFDISNMHSTISADNIKVTVTSDEAGTFSVAKGSNSFYISKIGPKDSVHKEIPIKVKADCTTKAYPLKVEFEYEYEGMVKPTDTLTSGLTVSETLNIQVEEDSRPALTNVLPGAYGELINGELNSVTFDFTNRGKSPLYNVEVTITGDFQPSQEVYFIGTVAAGTGTNHEMEITPTVEGTGTGKIKVTYEDSNGKQGKIEQEFTGEVMMGAGMDMGMDSGMGMDEIPADVAADTGKKAIVSVPVFIVIQIVLFLAGIFIVRKVVIKRYRKKKMLEEEQEL